jgi:hypothetical protein
VSLIVVYEGDTDLPVIRKLAASAGLEISYEIDCAGKGNLDRELDGYNAAAQGSPWLVVRDLDTDAPCAGAFLESVSPSGFVPSPWMCFRLAVHEIESWLMADEKGFSQFFEVDAALVPAKPDEEADPTVTMLNAVRKSRRARIRRAMLPPTGGSAQVGPLYEDTIIEFGMGPWSLARACKRSPSLKRANIALKILAKNWKRHISGKKANVGRGGLATR